MGRGAFPSDILTGPDFETLAASVAAETTARQAADATLTTAVAGKAPSAHTHTTSQITDLGSWAGSTAIVTLGTVATGIWHGTVISPAYLGTGTRDGTRYLRDDGTWQAVAGGGADLAIGATVTGGTAGSVIYLDGSGHVAQSTRFQFDGTTLKIRAGEVNVTSVSLYNSDYSIGIDDSDVVISTGTTNESGIEFKKGGVLGTQLARLSSAGGFNPLGSVQVRGNSYGSFTGSGFEVYYDQTANQGGFVAYDRTANLYRSIVGDALRHVWYISGSPVLELTASRSLVLGSGALATTAIDGYLYLPTCAGTPTGTPTAYAGRAPLVVDISGSKLWIYVGGWKSAALS